jgi:methylmalonyl-CoA mutase
MSDFYSDFPTVEPEVWMDKVVKDLKGKNPEDVLQYQHPIEGINYKAYAFAKEGENKKGTPNTPPYLRGTSAENNDWINNVSIPENNAKTVNSDALHHLMSGANGVCINLSNFSIQDCEIAVNKIEFEYITASFIYKTEEQKEWLKERFENKGLSISLTSELEASELLLEGVRSITIKGTDVQTSGGNVAQELAWCLHRGHHKLHELLNKDIPLEQASNQLKFQIGIGGNYFFEIAKIRSLRILWYNVVQAYSNENKAIGKAYIEAQTGFVNKSLKDPHTNLLRQTTEGLSAVVGGIDELTILPYNWYAESPDLSKTQRLATNIGLLLKEESYMDKVIDPSGGSYSIEELTSAVSDEAWKLFQSLENGNRDEFNNEVKKTSLKRIELVNNKSIMHIGVNEYFNPEEANDTWGKLPQTAFGDMLIIEQSVKIEA